ncbi:MAG TPA: hypothetical protein VG675_10485 [Bryobacteraceae bacterium]|nr:hypothetical protein [Bryobacteraceae bacterium]
MIDCDLEVDIAIEIRPGEVRCPRCFRSDLAPSLPRGWRDALMRKWGRIPRHCRACGKRFYVKQPATGEN